MNPARITLLLALVSCAVPTAPVGPSVLYANACGMTVTYRLFLDGVDESEWVLGSRQYRIIRVASGRHVVGYATLGDARTDTMVVNGPTVYLMGCT